MFPRIHCAITDLNQSMSITVFVTLIIVLKNLLRLPPEKIIFTIPFSFSLVIMEYRAMPKLPIRMYGPMNDLPMNMFLFCFMHLIYCIRKEKKKWLHKLMCCRQLPV